MDPDIQRIILKQVAHLFIDLPLNFIIIWGWAKFGVFDLFSLPNPSPRQSFGIACILLAIGVNS